MSYCGVINIDKPIGLTSREVVDRVVQLVRPAKAGHAGTLDPLATGVLVVCVGHATRLINFAQEGRKRYRARFLLGQKSDTDDITGNVSEGGDWSPVTRGRISQFLPEFIGRISQVPPQFSAVHVNGQRAYDLARRGQTVDIAPRTVEVFSIQVTDIRLPEFELEIECGSGTYIRSIGRDLGIKLGCGAVMTQLRRLGVGPFDAANSVPFAALNADSIGGFLMPAIDVVAHLRQRRITTDETVAIRQGKTILAFGENNILPQEVDHSSDPLPWDSRFALLDDNGTLLGIGEINSSTNRIQPRIVFPASPAN